VKNDKEKFKIEFKKRLYQFVLALIEFVDRLDKKDNVCRIISDQLIRSGTSILSNYVEAQSASSKKDFINFVHTSLKSANESKVWLALLRDSQRAKRTRSNELLAELAQIANILASSLLTLKGRK